MKILESAENYLESILILRNEKGRVRSIDIVNHLGFSKPSVSIAMKQLEENGYITRDEDGHIFLTDAGKKNRQGNLRTTCVPYGSVRAVRSFGRNRPGRCLQDRTPPQRRDL